MAIVTIRAMPYEAIAAFLRGDDSTQLAARLAATHDRVWIISVTNSQRCALNAFEGWTDGPVSLVEDGEDRLALSFDDVEPQVGSRIDHERYVYFDEEMARRVCEFVLRAHRDAPERRDLLLINCHAGVSRSGAIADFARSVTRVDYDAFRRLNPQVVPNAFVRRLLMDAWTEMPR